LVALGERRNQNEKGFERERLFWRGAVRRFFGELDGRPKAFAVLVMGGGADS